jgi:NADH dehydrogenase
VALLATGGQSATEIDQRDGLCQSPANRCDRSIYVLVMTFDNWRTGRLSTDALQERVSTALVWLGDAITFLSLTAWPLVDLLIRIWISKSALVLSVLISSDWTTVVRMAAGSYPIPDLSLGSTALLSQLYWLAAISLILGLATRGGAAVLLALTVASQVRVAALDLNLFWMALLAYYVLLGADRLSLDRLLSQGLKNSPLPQAGVLISLLDAARPAFTGIYLLALRLALMLTLLLAGGHMATAMMTTTADIHAWLPVGSAMRLFGSEGVALALLMGSGLATRATALLAVLTIGYHEMAGGDGSFQFYWTALLLLLAAKGPGPFSLDGVVLAGLRRSLPELSGSLEGLPRVVIVGAGFGGIACARALRYAPVNITLIDRQNYHLFQPLLYQVATAALSPADIAIPIRAIFRDQFNSKVMLATVTGLDTERREVLADGLNLPYDYLVIATGATHSYFGHDA